MRGWNCSGAHADELDVEPLADAIQRGDLAAAWIELNVLARDVPDWRTPLERARSNPKNRRTTS